MRVAFIVGGFPKLSETFVLDQVTGLIDLGHDVDIYARRRPGEAAMHPEVRTYGLVARTRYFELPRTRPGRVARFCQAAASGLWWDPKRTAACLTRAHAASPYMLLNNVMHGAAFRGREYDAVMCHFGGNGIDFVFLKVMCPRWRFVTMFHGDDLLIGDEDGPEVFGELRARGDAFLVTTDVYGRRKLRDYGFPEGKIVTHRLGIPVKKIAFRERATKGDEMRVLSVARLIPKKGLEFGIRAVVGLQAANPRLRVRYRIVGDGPLRPVLGRLAADLGATDTVEFLGAMTSDDVMQWMRDSDVFLLPSLSEAGGRVLLEAQASGLPLVASRVDGVPEMVREGRSAVLVPPADVPAAMAALQELADRRDLWPQMGHEGRQHVEERHDIGALNRELADILAGT